VLRLLFELGFDGWSHFLLKILHQPYGYFLPHLGLDFIDRPRVLLLGHHHAHSNHILSGHHFYHIQLRVKVAVPCVIFMHVSMCPWIANCFRWFMPNKINWQILRLKELQLHLFLGHCLIHVITVRLLIEWEVTHFIIRSL